MRITIFISIFLILFISCSDKENTTKNAISSYCNNELDLLCSFDSLPTWNGEFILINSEIEKIITNLFKDDICCKDLRFNVLHKLNSSHVIKISLNYYYHCDICPINFEAKNNCVILQNAQGQILFEGEFVSIDSVDKKIYNFYSKIGQTDFYPDSFDKIAIAINWDLNVSEKYLSSLVNQIIKGYLSFANEFSIKKYNKQICLLNQDELEGIANLIPIKLGIQTKVEIEDDFRNASMDTR